MIGYNISAIQRFIRRRIDMCTLSFSPTRNGMLLAMNRDESLQRDSALAPGSFQALDSIAIYPSESSGGTWLALNDQGIVLALLNRNPSRPMTKARSRGEIIPSLLHEQSLQRIHAKLLALDCEGFLPFTVVALDGPNQRVIETVWDGARMRSAEPKWGPRHWFSSSLSDDEALRVRGKTCEVFRRRLPLFGERLRELHSSHGPAAGAYSLCVHREGVATVSYAEVRIEGNEATFGYAPGSPCEGRPLMTLGLDLRTRQPRLAEAAGY